ncbi:MAG: hypothetical protein QM765_07930 [Myxococcales bacterium]
MLQHASAWAQAHSDHAIAALMITDGQPTECEPMDIPSIAAIAAAGLAGSPSVPTYMIGVFSDGDLAGGAANMLNAVASAGGTTCEPLQTTPACLASTSGDVRGTIVSALHNVRLNAQACRWQLPAGVVDPAMLNASLVPISGSAVPLVKVASGTCGTASDTWVYDDPTAPTAIVLCPATCTRLQAVAKTGVAITLGCPTATR